MKPYMPAIVVLLILAALIGAGLVTAEMLKSPQVALNHQVDEKVEEAQRLLAQYRGGQPALLAALDQLGKAPAGREAPGGSSTQPASGPTGDEAATNARNFLTERKDELNRRMEELKTKAATRGGEKRPEPAEFSSLEELKKQVEANKDLLDKALAAVQAALNVPGENGLSATSHPVATRLEAEVLQQQADLLRRRASVYRVQADAHRGAFDEVLLAWSKANNTVETLDRELKGMAGGTIGDKGPAPEAGAKPPKAPDAKAGVKPPAPGPQGPWLMDKLKGLFSKKGAAPEPAAQPTEPAPEPAPQPGSDNENQPAQAETKPAEARPVAIVAVPSVEERIKQLQAKGVEVDGQISEAQKEADRLSGEVKGLQADLAKARSQSDDAQKRMVELVNAGVDPVEPNALQKFMDEYTKASLADRTATHEATALQEGMVRNAKPDAQEENEILTAPLVPKENGAKLQESPGLTALEADLRAAEALVSSRQQLRKLVDAQIKTLQASQKDLTEDLAKAQAWRDGLAKQATGLVTEAAKASDEAKKLEEQALDRLKEGERAAKQAAQAVNDWTGKVSEFTRKNTTVGPQPQTGYMAGHAAAIEGDIELEKAWVLAQRSAGEKQQQAMTARMPGSQPTSAPTTQPASTVDSDQKDAIEAAKAAIVKYEEAAGKLGGMWTLHTQIAAAHYLMASLLEGDEAVKERALGLKEYQTATKDRGESARDYRPMIQALTAQ